MIKKKQIPVAILAAVLFGCTHLQGKVEAAEIAGPVLVRPGLPAVFELPVQAAWTVTPLDLANGKYVPDSSFTKIFFASPDEGTFTIVAACLVDGEVEQFVHTFIVSAKDAPPPNPNPHPQPEPPPPPPPPPPVITLGDWVAKNVPATDKMRLQRAASVYTNVASGIERGTIRTPDGVYASLRSNMQPIAVTKEWQTFMAQLNEKLQADVVERMKNLTYPTEDLCKMQALKPALKEIAKALGTRDEGRDFSNPSPSP